MHNVLDMHVHHIHNTGMKTLTEAMKERGISDEALAAAVGRHRSTITKIRLRQAAPSLETALKISREVGVPVENLFPAEAAQ
ncbi:helix-turn-helix transcriptional regulator [Pseudohoeflea coraliihabitans]|uniref:Helix-turn-helix domain-containing protein n=1 Tax=Pseudohoeflea coraliihabitans TaxID=2860393 RepID=A0ABS6WIH8_9HYPH|nr:helix-turn-helix transcriptional regulator [Pseudohoeflea sp. DP4N28-3]MBW3095665.1 helix-turn-helix domain-containing protein [Pseudohoeflea sp. DP4N28-3]